MLIPGRRSCLESSGESLSLQRSYGRLEHWPLREAKEVEQYLARYYPVQSMQFIVLMILMKDGYVGR